MWEDDRNKKGGRWLINLDKRQRHSDLDKFWLETVSQLYCFSGTVFIHLSFNIQVPNRPIPKKHGTNYLLD